jgi:uncharacterized protein (TIGR03089 family)
VTTPDALLAAALAKDPAGPLLTYYDDATGERVELSATTAENWVSKTANLLQEAGLEPGARVAVLLPPHWQTAVILLGCWRLGVEVVAGPVVDAVFAAADRLDEADTLGADQVWGLSLAPLGAPMAEVPAGIDDYAVEVRGMADRFAAWMPADPDAGGMAGSSLRALAADAASQAEALGLAPGDRVLVAPGATAEHMSPLVWLLAPLAAAASVVLVRHPDTERLDRLAAAERTTRRLP